MKKRFLLIAIAFLGFSTFAQEKTKVRTKEVGLTFYNFDGFGLTYRIGKEKAMWRFNTAYLNGSQSFFQDNVSTGYSLGASAGREWRKPVADKLHFRYGFDLQYNFGKAIVENDNNNIVLENKSYSQSGRVNFVVGFNYQISNSLCLGAELLPFFGYNYTQTTSYNQSIQFGSTVIEKEESSSYQNQFGIQNNSALISIVYRY